MRAFVSYINPLTGLDSMGTELQWVTPEYKSLKNLERYFLMNPAKPAGLYHVEAFNNWENDKYRSPNYDYIFHKRRQIAP